jgi:hypothetical protein
MSATTTITQAERDYIWTALREELNSAGDTLACDHWRDDETPPKVQGWAIETITDAGPLLDAIGWGYESGIVMDLIEVPRPELERTLERLDRSARNCLSDSSPALAEMSDGLMADFPAGDGFDAKRLKRRYVYHSIQKRMGEPEPVVA